MIMNYWWQLSLLIMISYFVGNFSTAIFISGKFKHSDIRELGSKNPGTTNMARVFGFKFGLATFATDFFKGLVCVLAGRLIFSGGMGMQLTQSMTGLGSGGEAIGLFAGYSAGLAVILGHNYPVLLGFKGGKGFAAGIGVFIAVNPVATLILLFLGVILLFITDRMSVFALAFFAAEAAYLTVVYSKDVWWIPAFACTYLVLAVIAHWPNIRRLAHGEEKALGLRKHLKGT